MRWESCLSSYIVIDKGTTPCKSHKRIYMTLPPTTRQISVFPLIHKRYVGNKSSIMDQRF